MYEELSEKKVADGGAGVLVCSISWMCMWIFPSVPVLAWLCYVTRCAYITAFLKNYTGYTPVVRNSCVLMSFEDLFSKDFQIWLTFMPAKFDVSDSTITKYLKMISFTFTSSAEASRCLYWFASYVTQFFLFILAYLCIISPIEQTTLCELVTVRAAAI